MRKVLTEEELKKYTHDLLLPHIKKDRERIREQTIDEVIKTLAESEDTILTDRQYYALQELKEKKQ